MSEVFSFEAHVADLLERLDRWLLTPQAAERLIRAVYGKITYPVEDTEGPLRLAETLVSFGESLKRSVAHNQWHTDRRTDG